MADNAVLNAGTGGITLRTTEDASSIHHQHVILEFDDGTTSPVALVGGAGAVAGGVQRVTLASDDPAVAALEILDDAVYADDADWTDGTSKHVLVGGLYQSTPQTITDGDVGPLQVTANGYALVSVAGTATITGTVTANLGATDNAVLDSIDAAVNGTLTVGSHAVTNAGTFAVQVDGDALTALQLIDDVVATDDTTTHSTGATKGVILMAAATPSDGSVDANDIGSLAMSTDRRLLVDAQIVGTDAALDVSGATVTVTGTVTANLGATDNAVLDSIDSATTAIQTAVEVIDNAISGSEMQVDVVAALPSGSNTIGVVDLGATDNAVLDQIEVNTSGSTTHYRNIDANAEDAIKGSAGTLNWLHAMNMTAAVAYLHLYDATTATVTPGSTTPDFTFPIATQGDTNGAGFVLPAPIEFGTAITLVCTTTLDGSAGDPGTNGVIVNAGYT